MPPPSGGDHDPFNDLGPRTDIPKDAKFSPLGTLVVDADIVNGRPQRCEPRASAGRVNADASLSVVSLPMRPTSFSNEHQQLSKAVH